MEIITVNKLKRLWNNGIVPKLLEKLDKTRVLTSKEQVQANTNAENVAGALVVKELFNKLNEKANIKKPVYPPTYSVEGHDIKLLWDGYNIYIKVDSTYVVKIKGYCEITYD